MNGGACLCVVFCIVVLCKEGFVEADMERAWD